MPIFNKINLGWRLPVPLVQSGNVPRDIGSIIGCLQSIEEVFVNLLGLGPRSVTDQISLAGSATTLLSGNTRRFYVTALVTLSYGDIISLKQSAGILQATKALATSVTTPADGFCSTTAGIPAGQIGEVILGSGVITFTGGPLVLGSRYFLSSTTSGKVTAIAPVGSGDIEQYIGIAIDTNNLFFNSSYWIQH